MRRRSRAEPVRVFLVVVILGYLAPFIITDFIDRYFLFVLPFLFALWASTWNSDAWTSSARAVRGLAVCWLAASLGWSTCATHDYFAWNRARWDAIHTAEKLGATPETLDGGFEYDGYARFEATPRVQVPGKSWWWVKDDDWVVAFTRVPGYVEVAAFPVRTWLPRAPATVRLLQRQKTKGV